MTLNVSGKFYYDIPFTGTDKVRVKNVRDHEEKDKGYFTAKAPADVGCSQLGYV